MVDAARFSVGGVDGEGIGSLPTSWEREAELLRGMQDASRWSFVPVEPLLAGA